MKRWQWITSAILVYLLALLVFIPAQLIYWLPLPKSISVTGVSGTLWNGEATQVVVAGREFRQLQWQLNPAYLVTGELGLELRLPAFSNPRISGNLSATLGMSELSVSELNARGELAELLALGQVHLPLASQGQWRLSISNYQVSAPSLQHWCDTLRGTGEGRSIQTQVNGRWLQLGTYPVSLSCKQGSVQLAMNGDNVLGLQLDADLNAQRVRLQGSLKPKAAAPIEVRELLKSMGNPDREGRYPFNFSL
ncbi:Type II secretory pathway, component PulN [Idiomarina tyrosinivorans]|uniref:Type II secretion system protein N n=1 Tax=Idiomarina tyrosinivorans TaxID=1445662 RepID=A0A432ZR16_9GAMM|nr:type II secretion system protein N [Idiomarina tyrosinivorans]RUO80292.1 Type II secretory pathway, component PulN [Idiomarina tyrosinivorans]